MDQTPVEPFGLSEAEIYWRDNYKWFLEQGYRLRSRYSPDWTPSWKLDETLFPGTTEDAMPLPRANINDAVRIADNTHVILKRISRAEYPEEMQILRYFSELFKESENTGSSNRFYCVRVLDELHPPSDDNFDIVVMPILRAVDSPEFDTFGEAVDFIRQLLEGFQFLYEHRVAHRDVRIENIMMDPCPLQYGEFHFLDPSKSSDLSRAVHPKKTRTQAPTRYYIIDFGFSSMYPPDDMPPSVVPRAASDSTLPELNEIDVPCNPFASDVYYVGNMLRMEFIEGNPNFPTHNGRRGFEFLLPLIEAMTREKPEDRITMKEAIDRFASIVAALSISKLRSRVFPIPGRGVRLDPFPESWIGAISFAGRRARYVISRTPAIPGGPVASSSE